MLINLESKINAINSAYVAKLSFRVPKTNIGTQKFDDLSLKTYGMVMPIY